MDIKNKDEYQPIHVQKYELKRQNLLVLDPFFFLFSANFDKTKHVSR